MSQRVTIKSIARDLGISHMTVSRALSDNPNVSKETRDAVLKRAKEMGYVKSAAAKAMRGDGTKIVGLLLPNIVNEFYARFADTMTSACEENSLHLIIHLTNDDIGKERRSLERLREVQAMAVVMVPAPGEPVASNPNLAGMKVIHLIRHREEDQADAAILVDDGDALRDAVLHLAKSGHQSIAYIGAKESLSSGRDRLKAYLDGLKAAGLSPDPAVICTEAPSFEMGRDCTNRILNNGLATSIVCGGVEMSNGALSAIMDRGIGPNRSIAFIGYGDPSYYAWIDGGVSTVKVPLERLAHEVAAILTDEPRQNLADKPNIRKFKAELKIR